MNPTPHSNNPQIFASSVFQQRKQTKLIDSLTPAPGQKCFEYNHTTGNITEAKYNEVSATLKGKIVNKIIVEPGHLYTVAINKKNAWKKFVKMLKN